MIDIRLGKKLTSSSIGMCPFHGAGLWRKGNVGISRCQQPGGRVGCMGGLEVLHDADGSVSPSPTLRRITPELG